MEMMKIGILKCGKTTNQKTKCVKLIVKNKGFVLVL